MATNKSYPLILALKLKNWSKRPSTCILNMINICPQAIFIWSIFASFIGVIVISRKLAYQGQDRKEPLPHFAMVRALFSFWANYKSTTWILTKLRRADTAKHKTQKTGLPRAGLSSWSNTVKWRTPLTNKWNPSLFWMKKWLCSL